MCGTYLVTFTHSFLSIKYLLVLVTFPLLVAASDLVSIDLEYNEHDEIISYQSTVGLILKPIEFKDEG